MELINKYKLFEDFFDELDADDIETSSEIELDDIGSNDIDSYKIKICIDINSLKVISIEDIVKKVNEFNEKFTRLISDFNYMNDVYPEHRFYFSVSRRYENLLNGNNSEVHELNDNRSKLVIKMYKFSNTQTGKLSMRLLWKPNKIKDIQTAYDFMKTLYKISNKVKNSVYMKTPYVSDIWFTIFPEDTPKEIDPFERFSKYVYSFSASNIDALFKKHNMGEGDKKKFRSLTLALAKDYNYKISVKDAIQFFEYDEYSREELKMLRVYNLMNDAFKIERKGKFIYVTIPEKAKWKYDQYIINDTFDKYKDKLRVKINGTVIIPVQSSIYDRNNNDNIKNVIEIADGPINEMVLNHYVSWINSHKDDVIDTLENVDLKTLKLNFPTDKDSYNRYHENVNEYNLPVYKVKDSVKKIINNKSPLKNSER